MSLTLCMYINSVGTWQNVGGGGTSLNSGSESGGAQTYLCPPLWKVGGGAHAPLPPPRFLRQCIYMYRRPIFWLIKICGIGLPLQITSTKGANKGVFSKESYSTIWVRPSSTWLVWLALFGGGGVEIKVRHWGGGGGPIGASLPEPEGHSSPPPTFKPWGAGAPCPPPLFRRLPYVEWSDHELPVKIHQIWAGLLRQYQSAYGIRLLPISSVNNSFS